MTEVLGIPGDYRIGCILSVPVRTEIGVIDHKGILTDREGPDGLPMVIHAAKLFDQQVVERPMSDYLLMAVGPLSSEGYPGLFSPPQVLERARSQLTKPWRPWDNCEHFVAWVHGIPVRSPQLRKIGKKAAATTGVLVGLFAITRLGNR